MPRALIAALSAALLICLVGCSADPFAAGKALGEKHTKLIQKDALDFETLTQQVEAARADYEEDADKRTKFDEGYREAVRPVRAKIAAMVMENAGEVAGQAIGDMMQGFGEGLGKAVNGFLKGIGGTKTEVTGSGEPSAEDTKEQMRDLGRGFGKAMKQMAEGAEAIAEGIEEELEKSE